MFLTGLLSCDFVSLLSHSTKYHQPRDGTTHNGMEMGIPHKPLFKKIPWNLLRGGPYRGCFTADVPSPHSDVTQMTTTYVKFT